MSIPSLGLPAFKKLAGTTYLGDLAFSSWVPTQPAKSRSYHGCEQGQPEHNHSILTS